MLGRCFGKLGESHARLRKKRPIQRTPESTEPVSLLNILAMVVGLVEKTRWRSVYANEDEKNVDVVNYGKLLLCFLIASDQRLSEQEAQLLKSFWLEAAGSNISVQQVYDLVASSQDKAVRVLSAPPKFFRALVAHDLQCGTNYATGAFQFLQLFVQAVVGVDCEVTDAEAETAARVLANLSAYAKWQGLELALSEHSDGIKKN